MTDPFGALALQRTGDTGVHDGAQYRESSRLDGSFPATYGNGTDSTFNVPPRMFQIVDGSSTSPVTAQRPTASIMRYEHFTGTPINAVNPTYNAALRVGVDSLSGNLLQPTAIWGYAAGYADTGNFCLGLYGSGDHYSGANGAGMGVYGRGSTFVSTGSCVGFGGEINAWTGGNVAYNDQGSTSRVAGLDLPLSTADPGGTNAGAYYAGSAIQIRPSSGTWDVGINIVPSAVHTASIIDQSSAPVSIDILADHSTAAIRITQNNSSYYSQHWQRTSAPNITWGLQVDGTGNLRLDEAFVVQKAVFTVGTPGANNTAFWISEGATPTLRHLKTFDPGAAGINFTAGQLVCVLV